MMTVTNSYSGERQHGGRRVRNNTRITNAASSRSTCSTSLSLKADLVKKSTSLAFVPSEIRQTPVKLRDHYHIGDKVRDLRRGKQIRLCTHRLMKDVERAVKVIPFSRWNEEKSASILNEYNILHKMDHPNILKMYEHFEGEKHQYFIMDYCGGGNFFDDLETWGELHEVDALRFMKRLLASVNYCHQNGIVHCDLRPQHILLEDSRDLELIRLGGFGNAIQLDPVDQPIQCMKKLKTMKYMAPESLRHMMFSSKSDIWSCGVIAYLILSDSFPFSTRELLHFGNEEELPLVLFDDPRWDAVSSEGKDFVRSLLSWDPKNRPSANQALHHPWIRHQRLTEKEIDRRSLEARTCLQRVIHPDSNTRMKQAVKQFIGSQLLLKQEREAIDRVFCDIDITNNGKLGRNEMKAAFLLRVGNNLSDEQLDEIFDALDKNNTGYIGYTEFIVATMAEQELFGNERLRKAFQFFDIDKSGYISVANLKYVLNKLASDQDMNAVDETVVKEMMAEVDKSGNGVLSYDDFLAMMLMNACATPQKEEAAEALGRNKVKGLLQRRRSSRITSSVFITKHPGQLTAHYEVLELLGKGGYGKVYACRNRSLGEIRAVKVLIKSRHDTTKNDRLENEFKMLKALDHPNILQMHEMFEDSEHLFIIMDACLGGDLCDELDTWGNLKEVDAAVVLRQLLSAMNYCHSRNIVHCDLKPDNILLEQGRELASIKIIDFGMASFYDENVRLNHRRGTVEYMAPEVVNVDKTYGPKSDIWSCGVIAYLILSNRFPFGGRGGRQGLVRSIEAGKPSYLGEPWTSLSYQAMDFVKSLLTVDEDSRPSAEEALSHRWIENVRAVGSHFEYSSASIALENVSHFDLGNSQLKHTIVSLIGAQLLLKEEKEAIDDIFRILDVGANGRLSKQEVQLGYSEYFNRQLSHQELDDLFDRVDTSGTGYIEYSEFVVAAMNEKDLLSKTKLAAAFSVFDQDGDGKVSTRDFKEVLESFMTNHESGSQEEHLENMAIINKIIKEAESLGHDGSLTFDDFLSLMLMTTDQTRG